MMFVLPSRVSYDCCSVIDAAVAKTAVFSDAVLLFQRFSPGLLKKEHEAFVAGGAKLFV